GNTTELTYYEAPEDPKNKWKLKTLTDRLDGVTQFAYAPNSENPSHTDATVTDALDRKTKYLIDDYGKPIQITNAKNETTKLAWDADFNVTRLEEPNGAVTTWTYDNNGLLLTETDAVNNAKSDPAQRKSLKLEYRYSLQDPSGKYHVADLIAKTSPEGRKFTFTYDDQGNLLSVTDPKGNTTPEADDYTTKYTYYDNGLLKTETDANGNVIEQTVDHLRPEPAPVCDVGRDHGQVQLRSLRPAEHRHGERNAAGEIHLRRLRPDRRAQEAGGRRQHQHHDPVHLRSVGPDRQPDGKGRDVQ